jgi:23S rRNA (cytosine1962-C5)-methyltransferase
VAVRTGDGRFVGRAFYSPHSVIGARILDRDENGPPIDADWFRARIGAAADLRRRILRIPAATDAWRCVHAEGDGLSGLVIDVYADVAVIDVGCRGMFEHLGEIEAAVREAAGVARTVVRSDPEVEEVEGFTTLDRRAPETVVVIREQDLRFRVDCRRGHKTGFFVDQRESRREAGRLAQGRTVLDLCCYTGGFALAAAKGGARRVLGIDLDEKAVALARENALLNRLDVPFEHADAFDFLRGGERAELVVLDPPKLASRISDLPRARKKSVDLNALAMGAVERGGLLLTFSCTGLFSEEDFLAHVREAARRADRTARVLRVLGQPPDHPYDLSCPESRYLTGFLLHLP